MCAARAPRRERGRACQPGRRDRDRCVRARRRPAARRRARDWSPRTPAGVRTPSDSDRSSHMGVSPDPRPPHATPTRGTSTSRACMRARALRARRRRRALPQPRDGTCGHPAAARPRRAATDGRDQGDGARARSPIDRGVVRPTNRHRETILISSSSLVYSKTT